MKTVQQKIVKFCRNCTDCNICEECDERFRRKEMFKTTAVHVIKKDITGFSTKKNGIIVDSGCPNSVMGSKDANEFMESMTEFQKEKLENLKDEENFNVGPSGPYGCTEKLRFPIRNGNEIFWGEISIVNANIPMLLGNNILKPLGTKMTYFKSGNGNLKLNDINIFLKETAGGHYTMKLTDLENCVQQREIRMHINVPNFYRMHSAVDFVKKFFKQEKT